MLFFTYQALWDRRLGSFMVADRYDRDPRLRTADEESARFIEPPATAYQRPATVRREGTQDG